MATKAYFLSLSRKAATEERNLETKLGGLIGDIHFEGKSRSDETSGRNMR